VVAAAGAVVALEVVADDVAVHAVERPVHVVHVVGDAHAQRALVEHVEVAALHPAPGGNAWLTSAKRSRSAGHSAGPMKSSGACGPTFHSLRDSWQVANAVVAERRRRHVGHEVLAIRVDALLGRSAASVPGSKKITVPWLSMLYVHSCSGAPGLNSRSRTTLRPSAPRCR
jgi:hypothetical protein